MTTSLRTTTRRLMPFEEILHRRSYRKMADEVHGMGEFPELASRMLGVPQADMERFCAEALEYTVVRDRARAARGTTTYVNERTLAYGESLYAIARAVRPKAPVETGVCTGITTGYLLEALRRNGDGTRLVSIDLPIFAAEGMVNSDGLRDRSHVPAVEQVGLLADPILRSDPTRWSLRLGDAKVLLPQVLDELGSIDLFYHDSEHSYAHMTFEFQAAWPRLVPNGLLVSDDVDWSDGARAAWRDFTAAHPGRAWRYFTPQGNRGVLQRPSA